MHRRAEEAPQSTYGAAGFAGSPATVNIPVWWYAVLAMTSGFNHAVVEGLPAASDLRTYEQQARLATIADPRLRQETSDFFSECYVPARSKYQAERPATAAVAGILTTYGDDDPDWMGSHVYRDTAGFYDSLRPTKQIPGWAYNAARDTEYDPASPPTWGKPTCKEWWEDGAGGLREKLINEADATSAGFSGLVVAVAPILASEQQEDAVVRTVLSNAPPSWSSNELVAGNTASTGWLATAENIVKGGLAAGGVITYRGAASASDGPRADAAGRLRLIADDRRSVPVLALDDGRWSYGDLHDQILERALVPGHVGGPGPHPVHVPGRERIPADFRQPRRARRQAHAAQHDHDQPLSGPAIALERDDGVGRSESRPLDRCGH